MTKYNNFFYMLPLQTFIMQADNVYVLQEVKN
jgi:hypothetical protein